MKTLKIKDYDLDVGESKRKYNEKLFDIVAPRYDLITVLLSFGRDNSWKKLLCSLLPGHSEPACLDLACGTGDITYLLAEKYPKAVITGLDLNGEMLNLARKRSEAPGFHSGNGHIGAINFELGDMQNTLKNDGSMDIVTGGYALRNSPDIGKTLKEIYRITKSGGSCAFLDFSKSKKRVIQNIQLFFLKLWGGLWGLLLHGNPEIYGYISDSLNHFPDRNRLRKMIEETGFYGIKTRLLFWGFLEIIIFKK